MKAWEIISELEDAWEIKQKGKKYNDVTRAVLQFIPEQSRAEREKAARKIMGMIEYPEAFVEFAAEYLKIRIRYQRRLL